MRGYLEFVDQVSLFHGLRAIDRELAARCRAEGCLRCGGPLHDGRYERKPRGERIPIPEGYCERLSLCCGRCRKRRLPASCLFLGRRVYWGVVVVLVTAAVQGFEKHSIAELCERFGVSRRTVGRWVSFFAFAFPKSAQWQGLRGRVSASVRDDALPRSLLEYFQRVFGGQEALRRCLQFLASGSAGGAAVQAG